MLKRAIRAAVVLLSLSVAFAAEKNPLEVIYEETITSDELSLTGETETGRALTRSRPDLFSARDGALLLHGLPTLTLLDGRRFLGASELGRMGMTPLDMFPVAFLSAVEVQKTGPSLRHGADTAGGFVDLRVKRYNFGGEVGFSYGTSTGKYGREDMSSYIIGGVGNEKFNVTAGVFYHESNLKIPRQGRR